MLSFPENLHELDIPTAFCTLKVNNKSLLCFWRGVIFFIYNLMKGPDQLDQQFHKWLSVLRVMLNIVFPMGSFYLPPKTFTLT